MTTLAEKLNNGKTTTSSNGTMTLAQKLSSPSVQASAPKQSLSESIWSGLSKTFAVPSVSSIGSAAKDIAIGAGKGFIDSSIGTASLLQKGGQAALAAIDPTKTYSQVQQTTGIPSLQGDQKAQIDEQLKSTNAAQKVGKVLEFGAELINPVGKAEESASAISKAKGLFNDGVDAVKNILEKRQAGKALDAAERSLTDTLDVIKPVLNKKEAIGAFEKAGTQGGVTNKGLLSKTVVTPTQRDIDIAKSVQGVVSKNNGPIDNIVNINKEISRVAEQEVKPFLEKNPVGFNFEDLRTYMSQKLRPEGTLKTDPESFSTYKRVSNSILNTINKTLKESAANSGQYGSITDFNDVWNARKVIDNVIEKELGSVTFDSPQYTGIRAAARDVRDVFSKFITDSLSAPGQMEKVNKMTEFLQEATKRGIDLGEEDAIKLLEQKFGISRSTEDMARAAFFQDKMTRLNHIYEARGNIAESNYKLLDKNFLERWRKQNPEKYNLLKIGGGLVGLGTLGSITKSVAGD